MLSADEYSLTVTLNMNLYATKLAERYQEKAVILDDHLECSQFWNGTFLPLYFSFRGNGPFPFFVVVLLKKKYHLDLCRDLHQIK